MSNANPQMGNEPPLMHGLDLEPPDTRAALDGLVELTATVCEVPVALVVIGTADGARLESEFGLPAVDRQLVAMVCWNADQSGGALYELADVPAEHALRCVSTTQDGRICERFVSATLRGGGGEVIGALCALGTAPAHLTPVQRRMFGLLARQVGEQLERRHNFTRYVSQKRVLAAVMKSVAAEVIAYDRLDRVRMWNDLYEENFYRVVGRSPKVGETMEELIRTRAEGEGLSDGAIEQFLAVRRAYHENPTDELAVDTPSGKSLLIREAVIPGGGTVATLFDVTRLRDAERAAEARSLELQQLARTDSLTSLANRRYFFEVAGSECERANRYKRPLSLVMLDLDHFKQVNDRLGHDAGDAVLTHTSGLMMDVARSQDLVARLGGEEFAVLLPETSRSDAVLFAERLRAAIEERPTVLPSGAVPVTVSLGVAAHRPGESDIAATLSRADECLYEAKDLGRNRVASRDEHDARD